MMTDSRNTDLIGLIERATAELSAAMAHTSAAIATTADIRASLSTPIEAPFKAPLKAPQTREEVLAAHRRAHRMGLPGKIEGDPELEAFIVARIDTETYAKVVAAIKAHFPPDRQTSVAAVQRWFKKRAAEGEGGERNRQKPAVPCCSRK